MAGLQNFTLLCLHTTTCRVCWAPIRGLLVVIWARVCCRVLTSRTTEPNMANMPNSRPLLNLKGRADIKEKNWWCTRSVDNLEAEMRIRGVIWDEAQLRTRGRAPWGWCERSVQTAGWTWWSAISHGRGTTSALGSPTTTRSWSGVSAMTARGDSSVDLAAVATEGKQQQQR